MAVVENWDESLFGDMLLEDLTRREKLICRKYWLPGYLTREIKRERELDF